MSVHAVGAVGRLPTPDQNVYLLSLALSRLSYGLHDASAYVLDGREDETVRTFKLGYSSMNG